MNKTMWIITVLILSIGWFQNGYRKGLDHNPRYEAVQLLRNTPAVTKGFKGSEYNYFGCEVKELNYNKKEIVLNKCNYKYITDSNKEMIKRICKGEICPTE